MQSKRITGDYFGPHRLMMTIRLGISSVQMAASLELGGVCFGTESRMLRRLKRLSKDMSRTEGLRGHTFPLDRITEAYELFGQRKDGVIKVAIRPW
jgi:threonine dehydrogenase-like Zn-dependent dehydrogenase